MAGFNLNNLVQGALGNYSEKTPEELTREYGAYLFNEEKISSGYQMIRDALLFTNIRIIFIDKQGATGKKTSFKSIFLDTIVNVEMETAGTGLDDSEITITFLENAYHKSNNERLKEQKFEFPKKTDIVPLYRTLGNISLANRSRINGQ
ncbi:PH domain-containing protein [Proteiniclasticum sp. SCR006]|uniref:PH domain-containing protein n=1 Tax=Proteiniclasticum aestuarii TaxID=2817862 RepID=A0A939KLD8_9CLOT|nr:PH domain-containing protein [Proteiniclasticum aestuarii]MBO1265575.1 PH domain-containing protein [Proteiniclasticum aestuarii]